MQTTIPSSYGIPSALRAKARFCIPYTVLNKCLQTLYIVCFSLSENPGGFSRPVSAIQPQRLLHHCCRPLLALHVEVRVDVRGRSEIAVPQPLLNLLERDAVRQQKRRAAVPLRYNYDKPEKPRRIKGFEVFSLVFSSFSKPKNHTEISRIIGGVSLTTNE